MLKGIKLQGVILLIQLLLITFLFAYQGEKEDSQPDNDQYLLLDKNKITSIRISDNNANTVELKKHNDRWLLPGYYQLPVNRGLLDELLEKLNAAKPGWPVAQSESAAERFHVSDKQFQRHMVLESEGAPVANIYLGDSPGLRKIYIRKHGETGIYAIDLALHLAPASDVEWFDKSLLKLQGDISEIHMNKLVLKKQEQAWTLSDLSDSESIDQKKVNTIATYLKYPQVLGVAARELVQKIDINKPDAQYRIQLGNEAVDFKFFKTSEGVILKSSQSDLHFIVAGFVAENLLGITRELLTKKQ